MSPEENLITLIRKWREGVKSARAESGEIRSKNPYGQKIHDLNLEWGATQRAHREKIRDEQAQYNAARQELLAQSAAWKKEYAQGGSKTPTNGRPKSPDYSDEVKIAAAKALRSGSTKTIIRVLMGADTARLNRALTEGEALLKAQEAEEEW